MVAIEISKPGPPEVLQAVERPKPQPGGAEVVIRVRAAGVARADTYQRQGKYPPPAGASDIPGLDVAGVIESTGADVSRWNAGDAVCAILAGGGYAEFVAVPAVQVLPVPRNWTAIEATTLPENLFTVYDNLVTRGGLRGGSRVLIHGGSSGIGSMAIMLSRAVGARPIATAGTDEKCRACLELGAEFAINYRTSDFVDEVRNKIPGGVDVVLDMVGGPYLERDLDCLASDGTIAFIATQRGRSAELDIGKMMQKRARIMGSTLRARSASEKGAIAARLERDIWPLLPGKQWIRPVVDATFPLTAAAKAHARMEGGEHIGKIVLIP